MVLLRNGTKANGASHLARLDFDRDQTSQLGAIKIEHNVYTGCEFVNEVLHTSDIVYRT